jgi:hypothetical protein
MTWNFCFVFRNDVGKCLCLIRTTKCFILSLYWSLIWLLDHAAWQYLLVQIIIWSHEHHRPSISVLIILAPFSYQHYLLHNALDVSIISVYPNLKEKKIYCIAWFAQMQVRTYFGVHVGTFLNTPNSNEFVTCFFTWLSGLIRV